MSARHVRIPRVDDDRRGRPPAAPRLVAPRHAAPTSTDRALADVSGRWARRMVERPAARDGLGLVLALLAGVLVVIAAAGLYAVVLGVAW